MDTILFYICTYSSDLISKQSPKVEWQTVDLYISIAHSEFITLLSNGSYWQLPLPYTLTILYFKAQAAKVRSNCFFVTEKLTTRRIANIVTLCIDDYKQIGILY